VDVLVFGHNPDEHSNYALVEIEMPKAWGMSGLFAVDDPHFKPRVLFSDQPDDSFNFRDSTPSFVAEFLEVSHNTISIKVEAPREKRGMNVYLKEHSKCSFVIKGIALPHSVAEHNVEQVETLLAQCDDSSQIAQLRARLDEERSKLETEQEMLAFGCIVSVKAAVKHPLVMRKHDVPMSPLHTWKEFKSVIRRTKWEDSNYEKIRVDKQVLACLKYSFSAPHLIYDRFDRFVDAYIDMMCEGNQDKVTANFKAKMSYRHRSACLHS
jgi:hypothetical protein